MLFQFRKICNLQHKLFSTSARESKTKKENVKRIILISVFTNFKRLVYDAKYKL